MTAAVNRGSKTTIFREDTVQRASSYYSDWAISATEKLGGGTFYLKISGTTGTKKANDVKFNTGIAFPGVSCSDCTEEFSLIFFFCVAIERSDLVILCFRAEPCMSEMA